MASLHFRLFLALALVLGLTSHVYAQGNSVGPDDLPDCAQPCAKNAATLVNCALTDIACLCSHSQFTSSTETCANTGGVCGVEDRSSVAGVLGAMCSGQSAPTSTSSTSSTSTSSTSTTSTATTAKTTTTASTSTLATPTTTTRTDTVQTPAAPTPATTFTPGAINTNTLLGGLTTTPTGSSTLVVVQTVVLPQTSALTDGALRVGGGVGAYAVLPVILAMAGGLLL